MKRSRLCALLAVLALQLDLVGCATTASESRAERMNRRRKEAQEKDWTRSNFSLSSNRDVDWRHVKKGRKVMSGPALDSY